MEKLQATTQTLYAELLQKCGTVSAPTGSLYEREIGGGRYLYLKATIGNRREDVHLGRVGLQQSTERMRERIEHANASLKPRRQLVQMLKTAGLPAPSQAAVHVVSALKWHGIMNTAVVVGTTAFGCYPALVGHVFEDAVMGTEDIDIATVNLAISADREGLSMADILKKADSTFKPLPSLSKSSLPSRFRSAEGFVVDLLTQTRNRSAAAQVAFPNLGASAQALQHMAWLIAHPAKAVLLSGSGLLVDVPQPARFAIHKLIVAQKRSSVERIKRAKDLAQARLLIKALTAFDREALQSTYEEACAQGKKGWAMPIRASLREIDMTL